MRRTPRDCRFPWTHASTSEAEKRNFRGTNFHRCTVAPIASLEAWLHGIEIVFRNPQQQSAFCIHGDGRSCRRAAREQTPSARNAVISGDQWRGNGAIVSSRTKIRRFTFRWASLYFIHCISLSTNAQNWTDPQPMSSKLLRDTSDQNYRNHQFVIAYLKATSWRRTPVKRTWKRSVCECCDVTSFPMWHQAGAAFHRCSRRIFGM